MGVEEKNLRELINEIAEKLVKERREKIRLLKKLNQENEESPKSDTDSKTIDFSDEALKAEVKYNNVAYKEALELLPFLEQLTANKVLSNKKADKRMEEVSQKHHELVPLDDTLLCELHDFVLKVNEKHNILIGNNEGGFYAQMATQTEKRAALSIVQPMLKPDSLKRSITAIKHSEIPAYLPIVEDNGHISGKKVPIGPFSVDGLFLHHKIKFDGNLKAMFVALEFDGGTHNDPEKGRKDTAQEEALRALGIYTLRVENVDVNERPQKVREILEDFVVRGRESSTKKPTKKKTVESFVRKLILLNIATWLPLEDLTSREF